LIGLGDLYFTSARQRGGGKNEGGGGNFSKVKWLVGELIGTQKQEFWRKKENSALPCGILKKIYSHI